MQTPMITLGGIPIPPEAGAPDQSTEPVLFSSVVRMSDGSGVKMTHASAKASGSISGAGLIPAGLDGLDYSVALQLLLTKPRSLVQPGREFVLAGNIRPDQEPWANALVDGLWRRVRCSRVEQQVTVDEVVGSAQYMIQWMPMYWVFADLPQTSMNTSHGWQITWEEV
jgi:hypothetical protein